jgi:hypothetical protein
VQREEGRVSFGAWNSERRRTHSVGDPEAESENDGLVEEKLEGTGARLAKEVLDVLVLELHGSADVGPAGFLAAEAQEERRVVRREGGKDGETGGKESVNVRKEGGNDERTNRIFLARSRRILAPRVSRRRMISAMRRTPLAIMWIH